jgi:hypothetical protein
MISCRQYGNTANVRQKQIANNQRLMVDEFILFDVISKCLSTAEFHNLTGISIREPSAISHPRSQKIHRYIFVTELNRTILSECHFH